MNTNDYNGGYQQTPNYQNGAGYGQAPNYQNNMNYGQASGYPNNMGYAQSPGNMYPGNAPVGGNALKTSKAPNILSSLHFHLCHLCTKSLQEPKWVL